jgi:DNA end-binding protein Ku
MAAARSVWKGFIQFSLVSVPVKAYTASASGGGKISLNQLHRECNSRIKYQKVCPTHGEVPADEIVSGYEFANGQYVVIDTDELDKLRSPAEKAVRIQSFIDPATIPLRHYSGRTLYLAPDGPVGAKPYNLLLRVMTETNRVGFAQVVMQGKEKIMLVRPVDSLLAMFELMYEQELKDPADFKDEVPKVEIAPEEVKLAKTLTEAMAVRDFDISEYKDTYTDRLTALIEAKVQGKEIVAPPADEAPRVINLMEALQRSVEATKSKAAAAGAKPGKLTAPSGADRRETAGGRKRKTS